MDLMKFEQGLIAWLRLPLLVVGAVLFLGAQVGRAQEVAYPNEAFAKLDVFEGNNLTKADKAFNAKQYRQAMAEYDAFLLEYPQSAAVSYAIYRKGRSLQLDGRRFEAIKQYNQVLDFFPNDVVFAAASLFQIGKSHWDNGEQEKAGKFWTRLADDKQYSKQPIAAAAINDLAGYLLTLKNEQTRAATYLEQVAVDFRSQNPQVARSAIASLIKHYVRTKPDEPKLRSVYMKARTFEMNPVSVMPKELGTDKAYFKRLMGYVKENGQFTKEEAKDKDAYYRYWAGVLDGKFADDDDYQIDLAGLKLGFENNQGEWTARLDKQFAAYQKAGDYTRIVKWIGLFAADKKKSAEYMAKIQYDQMKPGDILSLYVILSDATKDVELTRSVFAKIPLAKFSDQEKSEQIFPEVSKRDEKLVEDLAASYQNKELGKYRLLIYYQNAGVNDKALALTEELVKVPDYSSDVYFRKGTILHRMNKLPEAIAAYKMADNAPTNLFRIAECLTQQKKFDEAVAQLREVENFFKKQAPAASLEIARVYKRAGNKDKQIAALRGVLKTYPASAESSQAHLELEAMGIKKLGGAQDAQ
jgi:TolA-binding protein